MCELIGAYMLSLITSKFKDEVGLYHDDGLAVCKATPKEIEKTKKEVSNVFKSNGLQITIDANKKIVHFLDVTFDLKDESYKAYMKPNNKLSYVHRQSNHLPALLKNISLNINKRLTNISSSKEVFNESIAPYQQALKESGYDHKLTYNPEPTARNKRKRKRDITWYNPPFKSNIKTMQPWQKVPPYRRQMLPEKPSTLQDFQQTHSQTKLLMYAKHEIHHIVTPQTRSFKCKCNNTST